MRSIRETVPDRRFARAPIIGAACLVLGSVLGCGEGSTIPDPGDDADRLTPTDLIRLSWIGTFTGPGQGSVDDIPFEVDSARLSFRIDADSIRPADCPLCMTVTLDTLFSLVNVRINDAVRLNLQYTRDSLQWGLLIERFSSAGATGNIVQARLLAQPLGSGTAAVDLSYLMERPLN